MFEKNSKMDEKPLVIELKISNKLEKRVLNQVVRTLITELRSSEIRDERTPKSQRKKS